MELLNRFGLRILLSMTIILPVWVSLGRSIVFNIAGYHLFIYLIVALVLFIFMNHAYKSFKHRPDVAKTRKLTKRDTIALIGLYISTFLHSFFWLDNADSLEQFSVATVYFHLNTGLSFTISTITFISAMFFLALSFVLATQRQEKKLKK